jgi:hypothetical protein
MPAYDILTGAVLGLPILAFAFICLFAFIVPALHIVLVMGRAIAGQPLGLNLWVLGRVLPLLLILGLLALAYVFAGNWPPQQQFALGQFAIIFLVIAAVMVPIALPLLQAYGEGAHEVGLYVFALLAFLAMPVAAAVTTGVIIQVTASAAAISAEGQEAFAALPPVFALEERLSPCTRGLTGALENSLVDERPGAGPTPLLSMGVYFFWVDMTLKAAFLDFFEAFDCGTTNLKHNPDNLMMSAFVFLYRAFVQLIVLVAIAYPFTRSRRE